jgi:8-oxo-dGTP pyrophosphatase MutT (NUDIX family)
MNHLATSQVFERVRRLLGGDACRLQVAALPWRRAKNGVEIMLITSRDTGRWVLPKGWPEAGEELFDSAAREAVEEAGLKGIISSREAGRYFYEKGVANGDDIRCEVMVYPLEVSNVADKWKEKGQRKRKWMSAEKAAALVAEADLGKVILKFAASRRKAA